MALSYYHLNEFLKKNPQYGATPEQALKAAAAGAVIGAIFAGVSGNWGRAATMSANSLTGGAMAKVQGGDFVTGMGYMFATQAAAWGYESMVGYAATPEAGGDAVDKPGRFDPPVKDTNNIGTAGKIDPKSWCCGEGSVVSRAGNEIPGVNAVSGFHDQMQIGLDKIGGSFARNVFNIPGMIPAAGISYLAMMPAPVVVELSVKPRY